MSQMRENPDGSVTYWQDGADEPDKVPAGEVSVKAEPAESDADEPKKVSSRKSTK